LDLSSLYENLEGSVILVEEQAVEMVEFVLVRAGFDLIEPLRDGMKGQAITGRVIADIDSLGSANPEVATGKAQAALIIDGVLLAVL
jgi:hypothetical protein